MCYEDKSEVGCKAKYGGLVIDVIDITWIYSSYEIHHLAIYPISYLAPAVIYSFVTLTMTSSNHKKD